MLNKNAHDHVANHIQNLDCVFSPLFGILSAYYFQGKNVFYISRKVKKRILCRIRADSIMAEQGRGEKSTPPQTEVSQVSVT